MSRTFNTPQREHWNQSIHHILKAISNHDRLFIETKNHWHREKAEMLRSYVLELKNWIHRQENLN